MSSKTQVNVDVITEVKGLQQLKKAQNEFGLLGTAAKKLGSTFLAVFAGREIIRFAQESVKAFATNEKQVALLTNTLKNLGQEFAAVSTNNFIDHLALATGKTKEELIPAFQGLFIATGDAVKAQDALKLAMDVSAGTGKALSVVQIALSKGYLGNTTALTRLGAGLSKSLLATKDMKLITAQLAQTFKGDAAIAADTFQGKMDRLNVAMTEAKVTIGEGLVQALTDLGGSNGFGAALTGIHNFASGINDAILGTERLIKIVGIFATGGALKGIQDYIAAYKKADMLSRQVFGGAAAEVYKAQALAANAKIVAAAKAKTDAAALANAKAITKAKADALALDRAQLSLKLSGSTADMQNIEIQAALQRGQTDQVNNVLLLQRALLNGNSDQATVLAQEILKANGLAMNVDGVISSLSSAKDPFAGWPAASAAAIKQIAAIQASLDALRDKIVTVTVNTVNVSNGVGLTTAGSASTTAAMAAAAAAQAAAAKAAADAALAALQAQIDAANGALDSMSKAMLDKIKAAAKAAADAAAAVGIDSDAAAKAQAAADAAAAAKALADAAAAAKAIADASGATSDATGTGTSTNDRATPGFGTGYGQTADMASSVITDKETKDALASLAATFDANDRGGGSIFAGSTVINISNTGVDTTIATTQDASTNGTAVTVNRLDPFSQYAT